MNSDIIKANYNLIKNHMFDDFQIDLKSFLHNNLIFFQKERVCGCDDLCFQIIVNQVLFYGYHVTNFPNISKQLDYILKQWNDDLDLVVIIQNKDQIKQILFTRTYIQFLNLI